MAIMPKFKSQKEKERKGSSTRRTAAIKETDEYV